MVGRGSWALILGRLRADGPRDNRFRLARHCRQVGPHEADVEHGRLPYRCLVGFAKERMMEEDEQGWSFTTQFVCRACVDDYALETEIRAAEEAETNCDFCGEGPAASLDVLLAGFVSGLRNEYERAIDGVSWDGREGGYQWGKQWDTWDLVEQFDSVLIGEGLLDAVRGAVHDTIWVEVNFAWRRRDEVLLESWERFCEAVRYETRYVFWRRVDLSEHESQYTGEVPPGQILDEVGLLIDRLALTRSLPPRYLMWRAQTHSSVTVDQTASRLGTVPRSKAKQANRMSPAGITMFYGAEDMRTAVREVAFGSDDDFVTSAAFESSRESTVVDFTRLPPVPSMFDPQWGALRRPLIFLHHFVRQLSDRARPEFEQIDYVPTQVVTEYLLRIYRGGDAVDGLLYASSLTGETCVVLDVTNDRCVEQEPNWDAGRLLTLGLVGGSISSLALSESEKTG